MDSLRAAAAVGIKTEDIIEYLNRLSKTNVPDAINTYIRKCAQTFGKVSTVTFNFHPNALQVKMVIKQNKYMIESSYLDALQVLLKDSVVMAARFMLLLRSFFNGAQSVRW